MSFAPPPRTLLLADITVLWYCRVDFKNWKDEDDDEEEGQGQDVGKNQREYVIMQGVAEQRNQLYHICSTIHFDFNESFGKVEIPGLSAFNITLYTF